MPILPMLHLTIPTAIPHRLAPHARLELLITRHASPPAIGTPRHRVPLQPIDQFGRHLPVFVARRVRLARPEEHPRNAAVTRHVHHASVLTLPEFVKRPGEIEEGRSVPPPRRPSYVVLRPVMRLGNAVAVEMQPPQEVGYHFLSLAVREGGVERSLGRGSVNAVAASAFSARFGIPQRQRPLRLRISRIGSVLHQFHRLLLRRLQHSLDSRLVNAGQSVQRPGKSTFGREAEPPKRLRDVDREPVLSGQMSRAHFGLRPRSSVLRQHLLPPFHFVASEHPEPGTTQRAALHLLIERLDARGAESVPATREPLHQSAFSRADFLEAYRTRLHFVLTVVEVTVFVYDGGDAVGLEVEVVRLLLFVEGFEVIRLDDARGRTKVIIDIAIFAIAIFAIAAGR
mmetsp:Transcript_15992/g.28815  ORF Transcript_15992/g.28815 Transcript_15992/m.28815 type:complete len:399 (-) Transcript_15992:258-1454(-)